MKRKTTSEFIIKAVLVHSGKYFYDETDLEHRDSMGNDTLLLYYSKDGNEEMLGNKVYHSTSELISAIR